MKDYSVFNVVAQEKNLPNKIVAGLERISQAFKVLLWEKAKNLALSPIQIQLLIFIANHKSEYNNVSYLASEFNVTKPTISDAIRVLDKKKLILKDYSSPDSRSYTIHLSEMGKAMVSETENFAGPLVSPIEHTPVEDQEQLFAILSKLIYELNQKGILTVQRTCFACKYYQKNTNSHYCRLLEKDLYEADVRIDCLEFENKR